MRLGWVETPLPPAESRRPGLAWAALAVVAAPGVVAFVADAPLIVETVEPPPTPVPAEVAAAPPIDAALGVLERRAPPIDTEPARPAWLVVLAPLAAVGPPPGERDPLLAVS
jgi:hypothetical protein